MPRTVSPSLWLALLLAFASAVATAGQQCYTADQQVNVRFTVPL